MSTAGTGKQPLSLAFAILALGLLGVASLYLIPLEKLLPEGIDVPRIALLINPAILVAVATFVGWFAAPRAGLHAPVLEGMLAGTAWRAAGREVTFPAIIVGLIGALTLVTYVWATADIFDAASTDMPQPLATRMLYGGITEEVTLRWGLMSLVAWLLLLARLPKSAAHWGANAFAALLFGLGHLPALFAIMPDAPGSLVALVVAANAGLGMLFGWLYMRRGLECAMLAHALTHLGGVAVASVIGLAS